MASVFLTDEQRRRFGRFTGEPTLEQLSRYFHLDDNDRKIINHHRGDHNRLGFAVQLCTARFLGTFLEDLADTPSGVIDYLSRQLRIEQISSFLYYRQSELRWDHSAEIRRHCGFSDFGDPRIQFRLNRWLYACVGLVLIVPGNIPWKAWGTPATLPRGARRSVRGTRSGCEHHHSVEYVIYQRSARSTCRRRISDSTGRHRAPLPSGFRPHQFARPVCVLRSRISHPGRATATPETGRRPGGRGLAVLTPVFCPVAPQHPDSCGIVTLGLISRTFGQKTVLS
jgi:hypothetical protein